MFPRQGFEIYMSFSVMVSLRSVVISSGCFSIEVAATGDATCSRVQDLVNMCATC